MKLTKGMAYYFIFWILYLPFSIVLTLILNYSIEEFFVSLGIGALLLLMFLTGRLILLKLYYKTTLGSYAPNTSNSETPKDNLEGFRTIFTEVKNEEVQLS